MSNRLRYQVMPCARSIVDRRPLCKLNARYRSANEVNSAFHPSLVGKLVVINVFTWITQVETFTRCTLLTYLLIYCLHIYLLTIVSIASASSPANLLEMRRPAACDRRLESFARGRRLQRQATRAASLHFRRK